MSDSINYRLNTTGNYPSNVETTIIIYCIIIALLMPIAIIGNSLVLAAIFRTPSLRSPSTAFLCTLGFSDLVVGFIVQPLYIASEFSTVDFMQPLVELTSYIACGVSLWTMTAKSVDRFMALHYHMRYYTLVTTSRAIYTSVITFFIISLLSAIYFWNRTVYLLLMAITISISILISTVSYITIYRIVRRHQVHILAQQEAMQSSNAPARVNRMIHLKKSAINTFVFYIVMILCYIPVIISLSVYSLSFEDWTKVWNFADVAVFLNSSINPILYCWRLCDLRTAVFKIGRKMLCIRTEENHPNVYKLS